MRSKDGFVRFFAHLFLFLEYDIFYITGAVAGNILGFICTKRANRNSIMKKDIIILMVP